MPVAVDVTEDPAEVLDRAGAFLATDPVRHNVILTLLHDRVAVPTAGRYWLVREGSEVAGVVFQSPLSFVATVTPMGGSAVAAAVDAIVGQGVELPGVNGVAATAARFAGQWTERTKSAATPSLGQRIYEVARVEHARTPAGACRVAGPADRDLLVRWSEEFHEEATPHQPPGDFGERVDHRLGLGQLFVWEQGGPVAMTGISAPVCGVARIGPVYTPPAARKRGYAAALVGQVSADALAAGHRCMLYTDLGNPVSNSVYRALGYGAVDEVLVYHFIAPGAGR